MEVDQELRFSCKLCNKRYPCGKSLGGHMRSHVIANSAESEEKAEANMKKMMFLNGAGKNFIEESNVVEFGNGQPSYGLRENPKKTWRAVDFTFPLPPEKVCKQCGKGFQSMKALCGHMACHSEKDMGSKDDNSRTNEISKMAIDSNSDTKVEDLRLRTRPAKCKRYEDVVVKSSSFSLDNGSSSVSEADEQEQEDVALCLMMLSGNKGGDKAKKRSKYECLNCKKTFNSYQALGGHRPCHKRSLDDNAFDPRTARRHGESLGNDKSIGKNSSNNAPKMNKVCPFCHKVYKNGQALGGHKRSHFIGGQWENSNRAREIKPKFPNLCDLNLAAPEEDEDDVLPIPSREVRIFQGKF